MRALIMGAGAIGSVMGAFLAESGCNVTLVGRAAHMDAIRRAGLRVTGIFGERHVTDLRTCTTPDEGAEAAYDLVMVTVKSYDTDSAARAIAPFLHDESLVCACQNGLGNAAAIANHVGWPRTIAARAIFGAWLPEPGVAEVTVIANPTAFGTYDPATPTAPVKALAARLDAAGLPAVYTDTIDTVLWAKVAYNCALNPLSALLDAPYGRLLETEDSQALMASVIHELYAVGGAMGVALEPATPGEYLERLFHELIPPTAAHYASMREDFRQRRRTEIGALNGAIARYGAEHGTPCPVNDTLTRIVRAREALYLRRDGGSTTEK